MAETILEQILENVRRGTRVPSWGQRDPLPIQGPSSHQVTDTVNAILLEVEKRLLQASASAAHDVSSNGLTGHTPTVHKQLVTDFETCLCSELHSVEGVQLLSEAPHHDDLEQGHDNEAIQELQRVMALVNNPTERDPSLLDSLGSVAHQVSRTEEQRDRERDHDALADIHKMIEFLK